MESVRRRSRCTPSPATRLFVYQRSDFQCVRCGLKFEVPDGYDGRYALTIDGFNKRKRRPVTWILELDHIWPFLLGGRTSRDNLQALCTPCNVAKGASV